MRVLRRAAPALVIVVSLFILVAVIQVLLTAALLVLGMRPDPLSGILGWVIGLGLAAWAWRNWKGGQN